MCSRVCASACVCTHVCVWGRQGEETGSSFQEKEWPPEKHGVILETGINVTKDGLFLNG